MEKFINLNTIIKNDNYIKNKKYIICTICLNIIIDPFQCSNCNDIFCKKCIEDSIICKKRCEKSEKERNIFIINILSDLEFKCLICNINIKYYHIKEHYNNNHSDNNLSKLFENIKTYDAIKLIKRLTPKEVEKLKFQNKEIIYKNSK